MDPQDADSPPEHWLVEMARAAGLPDAADLRVPPSTPLARAWSAVAEACGESDASLARHVARHVDLPLADLSRVRPRLVMPIPESVARRYLVFPLRVEEPHLVLATANPVDLEVAADLAFASGRDPLFEVAAPTQIAEVIDACYAPDLAVEHLMRILQNAEQQEQQKAAAEGHGEERADVFDVGAVSEGQPVTALTHLILQGALRDGASDVHIEPGHQFAQVRFRIDGVLRQRLQMPLIVHGSVVARIKVMGLMDIADHLRPQDGRARIRLGDHAYDLRISTVPTRGTEKAVIRILDPGNRAQLPDLSITGPELVRMRGLLETRDGIVIVTGPTGSGKTTTLYGALNELVTGEENIMTVEDPIEYELPGITQMQVDTRMGVKFDTALRHILRQDPDVVFVGEIRDMETAEVAVQAAMTGHLVLTTLHTNDAVGTVARLADLGLSHYLIAETLRGALAQRLVRRLCPRCKRDDAIPTAEEAELAARYRIAAPTAPVGCRWCERSGYRGRLPLIEVMVRTPELQQQVADGAGAPKLLQAAIGGGMRPLAAVAIERVQQGETSLQEVHRVVGDGPILAELARVPRRATPRPTPPVAGAPATAAAPETAASHASLLDRGAFAYHAGAAILGRDLAEPMSLAIIELGPLQDLQAAHGEAATERLLSWLSETVASRLPGEALICRWHPTEVVTLLPGQDAATARARLLVLLRALGELDAPIRGGQLPLHLSAGISEIHGRPAIADAVAHADRYLHRARDHDTQTRRVMAGSPAASLLMRLPPAE